MTSLRIFLLPAPGSVLVRVVQPWGVHFRRFTFPASLGPAALYDLAALAAVERFGSCELQGTLWAEM